MTAVGQELEFAAVRKRTAGCVRAKVTCGPKLPFDRTKDLADATAQSGRWFGLQQFQASEGRRVPLQAPRLSSGTRHFEYEHAC